MTQVTAQGVKVVQLSCAAHVNWGDGPEFLHIFTNLCHNNHLPKCRQNWAASILQPVRATSMGSRCRLQKSKLLDRDKALGYDT